MDDNEFTDEMERRMRDLRVGTQGLEARAVHPLRPATQGFEDAPMFRPSTQGVMAPEDAPLFRPPTRGVQSDSMPVPVLRSATRGAVDEYGIPTLVRKPTRGAVDEYGIPTLVRKPTRGAVDETRKPTNGCVIQMLAQNEQRHPMFGYLEDNSLFLPRSQMRLAGADLAQFQRHLTQGCGGICSGCKTQAI